MRIFPEDCRRASVAEISRAAPLPAARGTAGSRNIPGPWPQPYARRPATHSAHPCAAPWRLLLHLVPCGRLRATRDKHPLPDRAARCAPTASRYFCDSTKTRTAAQSHRLRLPFIRGHGSAPLRIRVSIVRPRNPPFSLTTRPTASRRGSTMETGKPSPHAAHRPKPLHDCGNRRRRRHRRRRCRTPQAP